MFMLKTRTKRSKCHKYWGFKNTRRTINAALIAKQSYNSSACYTYDVKDVGGKGCDISEIHYNIHTRAAP